jgi:hypothetical protein
LSGAIYVEPELAGTDKPAWAWKALGVGAPRDGLVGSAGKGGDQQQQRRGEQYDSD